MHKNAVVVGADGALARVLRERERSHRLLAWPLGNETLRVVVMHGVDAREPAAVLPVEDAVAAKDHDVALIAAVARSYRVSGRHRLAARELEETRALLAVVDRDRLVEPAEHQVAALDANRNGADASA